MTKNELIKKLKSQGVNTNNLDYWALSIEAYDWIIENIPKSLKILELGSGNGSRELLKYWDVTSVEHNSKFIDSVENLKYIFAPLKNHWYDSEYLKPLLPKQYDLLIIDGPPGSDNRLGILDNLDLFYLDCPILVDDVHADSSLKLANSISATLKRKYTVIKGWQKSFAVII